MQIANEWTEWGSLAGRATLIQRLLRRRFGELPTDLSDRIQQLDSDHLDALGDELLDFKSLAEAQHWIESGVSPSTPSVS